VARDAQRRGRHGAAGSPKIAQAGWTDGRLLAPPTRSRSAAPRNQRVTSSRARGKSSSARVPMGRQNAYLLRLPAANLSPRRMGGRAVEGTGLENRQGATPRGFESHPIRHHPRRTAPLLRSRHLSLQRDRRTNGVLAPGVTAAGSYLRRQLSHRRNECSQDCPPNWSSGTSNSRKSSGRPSTSLRTFTCDCQRCGGQFTIRVRGWFRAQRPRICPDCHARRQREYLHAWRARKRAKRSLAIASRTCNACGEPMPDGRADRKYCSGACRQRAYRGGQRDGSALVGRGCRKGP
jgi:hypothetical protein